MDKDKGGKKISIYSLFKEISETTGKLSAEAYALRTP
jgi:hypothetical protein